MAALILVAAPVGFVNAATETSRATGTITAVGYQCDATFTDSKGAVHSLQISGGKMGCDTFHSVGDRVSIYYDPSNPVNAGVNSPTGLRVVGVLALILGIVWGYFGLSLVILSRRQRAID